MEVKLSVVAVLSADESCAHLNLPSQSWTLAKELVSVLSPFEKIINMLGGEKYVTMSLLLPIITGLQEDLATKVGDSSHIQKLKKALDSEHARNFPLENLDPISLPVLWTTLDPRFHDLEFFWSDDDRLKVHAALLEELKDTLI